MLVKHDHEFPGTALIKRLASSTAETKRKQYEAWCMTSPARLKNNPLGTLSYHVRNLNARKAPWWKNQRERETEREKEMFQEPRCSRPGCVNSPSPGGRWPTLAMFDDMDGWQTTNKTCPVESFPNYWLNSKSKINSYLKLLGFGVICYTVIDNHVQQYIQGNSFIT